MVQLLYPLRIAGYINKSESESNHCATVVMPLLLGELAIFCFLRHSITGQHDKQLKQGAIKYTWIPEAYVQA
jgi:hypothetical protein